MADITPMIPSNRKVIDAYGDGRFRVSGVWLTGAIIVFPERTVAWEVESFASLTADRFAPVAEADPPVEVLLLGSGERTEFFPRPLREALRAKGIVADVMATGAACRTYNVLLAEGRRVAAALLPV